ncbi:hypothetical protein DB31_1002 [Hyalangium minutum]|uniref:Uncharacterized protein n=1 Tax=Hyalangium minutum TaxID=394096 RepID=A0A085WFR6_9BACT|nr:hypothetical protein DB31_1002 [Hyalangium minutum]
MNRLEEAPAQLVASDREARKLPLDAKIFEKAGRARADGSSRRLRRVSDENLPWR